jgi:hypothetical protein
VNSAIIQLSQHRQSTPKIHLYTTRANTIVIIVIITIIVINGNNDDDSNDDNEVRVFHFCFPLTALLLLPTASSVQTQAQAGQHDRTGTSATMDASSHPDATPGFNSDWYVCIQVEGKCCE